MPNHGRTTAVSSTLRLTWAWCRGAWLILEAQEPEPEPRRRLLAGPQSLRTQCRACQGPSSGGKSGEAELKTSAETGGALDHRTHSTHTTGAARSSESGLIRMIPTGVSWFHGLYGSLSGSGDQNAEPG